MDQEEALFSALERHAKEQAARRRKTILQALLIIVLLAIFIGIIALGIYVGS